MCTLKSFTVYHHVNKYVLEKLHPEARGVYENHKNNDVNNNKIEDHQLDFHNVNDNDKVNVKVPPSKCNDLSTTIH